MSKRRVVGMVMTPSVKSSWWERERERGAAEPGKIISF